MISQLLPSVGATVPAESTADDLAAEADAAKFDIRPLGPVVLDEQVEVVRPRIVAVRVVRAASDQGDVGAFAVDILEAWDLPVLAVLWGIHDELHSIVSGCGSSVSRTSIFTVSTLFGSSFARREMTASEGGRRGCHVRRCESVCE